MTVRLPTASSTTRPRSKGYGARINDLLLRLAVGPEDDIQLIDTASNEPIRLDTAANPEDFTADAGRVYSMADLTGGEGLDFAHRVRRDDDDTDASRFWKSRGINVERDRPGTPRGFTLSTQVTAAYPHTTTNTFLVPDPTTAGAVIYAVESTVWQVDDVAGTPSRTSEDPSVSGSADITGLAVIGEKVYAAAGTDHLNQRAANGTWSNLNNADTFGRLWSAKGRLLAEVGANLAQVDLSSGSLTTVVTGLAGTSFVDVVDAGAVVLAATSDGTVYSLALNDSLALVVSALVRMPEPVSMLAYNAGSVLVGTRSPNGVGGHTGRLYAATVGSQESTFALADITLVRTWDDAAAVDYSPHAAFNTRDSILFATFDGTDSHVWRFRLASAGIVAEWTVAGKGPIRQLAHVAGRVVAGVDGGGLYVEQTSYVASGWLVSPAIDFYTASDKVWTDLIVHASGLGAGATVDVFVSRSLDALLNPETSITWQFVQRFEADGATGYPVSLATSSRWLIVKVVATANGAQTSAPLIQSLAVEGFPQGTDLLIRVPVNVSDRMERPNRKPFLVPGYGRRVHAALHELRGQAVTLELYREELTVTGTLERITTPQRGRGRRGYPGERSYVEIRGRVVRLGTATSEGDVRGVGLRGVPRRG